jgi:general stress protein CsbA
MKKILFNQVTWYSKLIALALFVALPFISFYLGIQYEKVMVSIAESIQANYSVYQK